MADAEAALDRYVRLDSPAVRAALDAYVAEKVAAEREACDWEWLQAVNISTASKFDQRDILTQFKGIRDRGEAAWIRHPVRQPARQGRPLRPPEMAGERGALRANDSVIHALTMTDDEAGQWWWLSTAEVGNWPERGTEHWRAMPKEMRAVFIRSGQTALLRLRRQRAEAAAVAATILAREPSCAYCGGPVGDGMIHGPGDCDRGAKRREEEIERLRDDVERTAETARDADGGADGS